MLILIAVSGGSITKKGNSFAEMLMIMTPRRGWMVAIREVGWLLSVERRPSHAFVDLREVPVITLAFS